MKRDWGTIAALAVFLMAQTIAAVWWASSLTTSARFTAETVAELKMKLDAVGVLATVNATQDLRLGALETRAAEHAQRLRELEQKR